MALPFAASREDLAYRPSFQPLGASQAFEAWQASRAFVDQGTLLGPFGIIVVPCFVSRQDC